VQLFALCPLSPHRLHLIVRPVFFSSDSPPSWAMKSSNSCRASRATLRAACFALSIASFIMPLRCEWKGFVLLTQTSELSSSLPAVSKSSKHSEWPRL